MIDPYYEIESSDDAESEEEEMVLLYLMRKKQNVRSMWVRNHIRSREEKGEFHSLIPDFDDETFRRYFRLTRAQFMDVHKIVESSIKKQFTTFRAPIGTEERLAVALRYLSTGMSFRAISYSYRMGESTVAQIVNEVCDALWEHFQPVYLPNPDKQLWLRSSKEFKELWQFNNCVGAVDGKHVTIRKPMRSGSQFFNYKKQFSIVLFAVVDADYKFSVVDIGSCGKFSDGHIMNESTFGKALRSSELDLPEPCMLESSGDCLPHVFVGDEAFPLLVNLMRPFPKSQLEDTRKKIFNYRLSRARRLVESAFGILAARWRVFLKPFECDVKTVDKVVKATVVLHNYLRSQKNSHSVEQDLCNFRNEEEFKEPKEQLLPLKHYGYNASKQAFQVREKFMNFFCSPQGSIPWQMDAIRKGHF